MTTSNLISAANPQQLEAIETTEGPLLIIAGPGSGKTFTLVERVVYLLTQKGITSDHIMVVTFTDKAAQELTTRMSNRLDQLGVRFNLNEMYLGTFHSICLRWLQDHREFTRLKHNFTVFDEFDQHYFVYQRFSAFETLEGISHLADNPATTSTWERSELLLKWINIVSEEALDIQTLLAAPDAAIQALGRCAQLYYTLLEEQNALDSSTIQREALHLLRNYPSVRNTLKERILYVMVDEYQDTNTIQERILLDQRTGQVYLSKENISILDDELQQNFRVTVQELEASGGRSEAFQVHVKLPVEKVRLIRVRSLFRLKEKSFSSHVHLRLDEAPTDQYRMMHEEREGLSANGRLVKLEDISKARKRRIFSAFTLVAEIARYLNRSCLDIEQILMSTVEGTNAIVGRVNEFNELLYDWVIPHLFKELYEIKEHKAEEEEVIELVKVPSQGYYEVNAKPDLVSREHEFLTHAEKSFHLDTYCFDSHPEQRLFVDLLNDEHVKKVYFTGMLTHGQSDFFIQYIDPSSHAIRSYYPDFLLLTDHGQYVIVEVKADYQIDAPIVLAKRSFADKTAAASNMAYFLLKASDAQRGNYEMIWSQKSREMYLTAVIQPGLNLLK